MNHSFNELLMQFIYVRDYEDYRSDPEREKARLESLESTVQGMLELLRDRFES